MTNNKNGFSLIELTFALMITGMGILAIFHVFPSGLDAGKSAVADTRAVEFAQSVFEAYRYEVSQMDQKAWDDEFDDDDYTLDKTVSIPSGDGSGTIDIDFSDKFQAPSDAIEFPAGSKPTEYIRYKLATELLPDSDNLVGIYLEVSYGRMSSHKKAFYTAIYYRKM
jgi:prepilin-type N-terminal cleavage/methylation domain-containing protein